MSNKKQSQQFNNEGPSSWKGTLEKVNNLVSSYANFLPMENIFSAFSRAGFSLRNQPQIQNSRIKAISSLPVDYTKEQIGEMLRNPYQNEMGLRQTSQILRWTAYPYFKISKTYQDIPTYKYYTKPLYIDKETAQSDVFKREAILLDKINKAMKPNVYAHKITGQSVVQGKVAYHLRTDIDKVHNKVNYVFMQQLPEDFTVIIGYNNISGYTVSFNMMYFLKPGTDYKQFGDLFNPFVNDFSRMFDEPVKKEKKFVYASVPQVECKGKKLNFYPANIDSEAIGNPKVFMQNGQWMYYVSLPIDKIWVFEIDDTTPAVASPLAGLMLTYAQQSDYEAAQLSLLLNPLIKIFTGEIPYYDGNGATAEDSYKLSEGGRLLFEAYFANLMAQNNTGGTAFYSGPFENIKSHDFSESANANEISESFNRYGMQKAGLSGLIPVSDDVKASQVDASMKIESRFSTATIYPQFEKMMNSLYKQLNLNYDWEFKMFGTIFNEKEIRESAQKALDNGDLSAIFTLSALDEQSWVDKLSMLYAIKGTKLIEEYQVLETAYTQSKSTQQKESGRPKTSEPSDTKEKSVDAGVTEVE